jgi:N-acetylneuraminic acid mutarotase
MAMTGTVVLNGKALIAGGQTATSDALGSSELYTPATGTFTLTGRLVTPRSGHTATLLASGLVLIAGGENVNGISLSKTELYKPATGTFAATANMPSNRQEHRAVLLPSGSVLVVGGNKVSSTTTTVLASCAIYNPATGSWTTASTMKNARADHTATLLHNGHVLVTGGDNTSGELATAELF